MQKSTLLLIALSILLSTQVIVAKQATDASSEKSSMDCKPKKEPKLLNFSAIKSPEAKLVEVKLFDKVKAEPVHFAGTKNRNISLDPLSLEITNHDSNEGKNLLNDDNFHSPLPFHKDSRSQGMKLLFEKLEGVNDPKNPLNKGSL